MEVTTIIGIVVAVIIILIGLRMILRKPDEAAPSLESELHINPESNQPVIPRHVRDQLQADQVQVDQQRVEPNLATLEQVEVAEDNNKQEAVQEQIQEPIVPPTVVNHETVLATEAEKNVSAVVVPSDIQIESKVQQNESTEIEKVTEESATTIEKTEEFKLNPNIETAKIEEFDDESNILDVHLHEQQRFDDECSLSNAESLIALNVYPNPRKALSGDKSLKLLLKYGLRYGEMSCFHRYENIDEPSPLMFSVLRLTDNGPEGFDLETLSTEQVQGLAFFLALPHPDVQKGFDTMVSIAGLIAREIDGTVYDENNLEFTPQLKEHWRHKAIDYRSGQEV